MRLAYPGYVVEPLPADLSPWNVDGGGMGVPVTADFIAADQGHAEVP